MVLSVGRNAEEPESRRFGTTPEARQKLVGFLKARAAEGGADEIVFAYEASAFGYGLYDDLREAGIRCEVLAPTRLERSAKDRKRKTDTADALRLLEVLRGHVLAGNKLPTVWVPDRQTRADREVVRARLDLAHKCGGIRTQIGSLLSRRDIWSPSGVGKTWTRSYRDWLVGLAEPGSELDDGTREGLLHLLRELSFYEQEIERSDEEVSCLAKSDRYSESVAELCGLNGVGELTAMVFLTELGDLKRFRNRRSVANYLGVVPTSNESGEETDRKGHITHQGPCRVRRVLCQAAWARVRTDRRERAWYDRLVERNPKRKKIALVGSMRRLGILMWHRAREVQERREKSAKAEG
jgi:transposase